MEIPQSVLHIFADSKFKVLKNGVFASGPISCEVRHVVREAEGFHTEPGNVVCSVM